MQPRDIVLTLIGPVLTAWVAALLVRRKLHREFPFFFVYLVVAVLVPLLRLAVSGDYPTFFKVAWATEAIYAVLALLALYEAFREVFLAFYMLWWWFALLFPGAVGIAAFVQVRRAILHPPVEATPLIAAILSFSRVINWVEAVLFGLFFVLVLLLGVRWKSYPFGIVEGFGLSALGAFLAYGLRSEFGTKYATFAKYAPPVAYLVGVVAWLLTFLGPPDPEVVYAWRGQVTPEQFLAQARALVKITRRIFWRKTDDS
jgi:predicted secreted protein